MTIEMGRLVPAGQVYAIEKDAAGLELIEQNVGRFGVKNVPQMIAAATNKNPLGFRQFC